MPYCEDYPCCGHEPGDCPDAQGRMKCVECGKRLPKTATSSICPKCLKSLHDRGWGDESPDIEWRYEQ